jgi:hypothetical protein
VVDNSRLPPLPASLKSSPISLPGCFQLAIVRGSMITYEQYLLITRLAGAFLELAGEGIGVFWGVFLKHKKSCCDFSAKTCLPFNRMAV